jgi:hypothetical protein
MYMFILLVQTIDLRVVRFGNFGDAFRCTNGIVWPPEVCHILGYFVDARSV